jgi:V8-like Glu-specific endopeptidase
MLTMRRPKVTGRAQRAAALALAALLQIGVLLGAAEAEEGPAREPLATLAAELSPAGRGHGDRDNDNDRDDRSDRRDRDDDRADPADDRDDDPSDRIPADRVVRSVGQIYHSEGACSATVIPSESEQLALTAAHCVYIPEQSEIGLPANATHGWVEDAKFVPGRSGDDAPDGIWRVSDMWVDQRWKDTGKAQYDIAVLRIAKNNKKTIQDVVGSQGYAFQAGDQNELMVLGYPAEPPFDGTAQRRCLATKTVEVRDGFYDLPCSLNDGSSGGPFITDINDKKGIGTVVAVTSFRTDDGKNKRLYGVPLGRFVRDLINEADA